MIDSYRGVCFTQYANLLLNTCFRLGSFLLGFSEKFIGFSMLVGKAPVSEASNPCNLNLAPFL
jgi:hypothetical protein